MFFFMFQEIDKLGDVITMSHVHVYSENGERKERLFLLFSSQLVMLSVSPRMSGYQYEVTQKIKHFHLDFTLWVRIGTRYITKYTWSKTYNFIYKLSTLGSVYY